MASHLSLVERETPYRMKKAGKPFWEIAEGLGRDPSAIYREVNRNTGGRRYRPQQAQRLANPAAVLCIA